MSDTPNRLYMCHTTGGGQFYVVAPDETTARRAVEQVWGEWGYIERKGRVNKIDVLAEEGQYPQVPDYEVLGPSTWLLLRSTEPPNAEGVSEAMIERALHAPVPGGAEVWHWLPQTPLWSTGFTTAQPHQTAHNVMRAALEAALARPVAGNGGMSNTIDLAAIEKAAKASAYDDCALEARRYAGHYKDGTDGRNTFILLAERFESIAIGLRAPALMKVSDEPTLAHELRAYATDWRTRAASIEVVLKAAAELDGQSATILALCERIREPAKVKPLDWSETSPPNDYCPYHHFFADTPFGRYQVEWKGWKDHPGFSLTLGDKMLFCPDDPDEAKAAAQADYDSRIRSALITETNNG